LATGYLLTAGQIAAIREVVRRVMMEHRGESMTRHRQQHCQVRRIAVVGELSAPTSSVDEAPTEGIGAILQRSASTGELSITDERVDFVNYTPDFTASDGTYGIVLWIDGIWELIWLACDVDTALDGLDPDP